MRCTPPIRPAVGGLFQKPLTCGRTRNPSSQYAMAGARLSAIDLVPQRDRIVSNARSVIGVVMHW